MLKPIRILRRRLRTYSQCFGFLSGLSIFIKELMARHPEEITISYAGIMSPVYLRINTSDIMTFVQVFQHREYEIKLAKKPNIIIDAGANIGLASIYYANKYPDAKIVAIEPEPSNFNVLKKNVSPYANIVAVNKALWSENTHLDIVDPGLGKWGFQTRKAENTKSAVTMTSIESITIEKLIDDHAIPYIDILKIDIEGAEREVFSSSSAWIDKVGVIAIELHDRYKMGCSRALYNATNQFDLEIHKGEHIFLLRKPYVINNRYGA